MKNKIPILFIVLALTGCASVPGKGDPRDPFEGYNRAVYKFNDAVDRAILKPVAQGYDTAVPGPVKTGIRNFFSNLGEVVIIANDLLQGKGEQGVSDLGRFLMNSTIGLIGLIDIATPAGLTKNNEDFGQTLGKWGVGPGPYFMLPFIGPSTVRDAFGRLADSQLQYFTWVEDVPARNSAYAVETIDTRAGLLKAGNILDEASLDPYNFLRDAYLQRRQRLVYDGNPPHSKDDLEEEDEPTEPTKSKDTGSDTKPADSPPVPR
ncbi:MAG: VacJ family lipoprotein [Burkholderiales bacterium]|nr:VacJ family lipoprotein [Burkholderiales bacterium]